jgi:hypothetical protein
MMELENETNHPVPVSRQFGVGSADDFIAVDEQTPAVGRSSMPRI